MRFDVAGTSRTCRRSRRKRRTSCTLEHPIETAKELEHEAEEGRSARTPLIALTGVTLVLSVILAIMLAITMTLYFVYGGK